MRPSVLSRSPSETTSARSLLVLVVWRELYLYLRPGELYELRWKDVDLDLEIVSISRAFDWEDREVKPPKTQNGIRDVPIPFGLLPLLTRMLREKASLSPTGDKQWLEEKVVPIMSVTGENRGAAS